MMDKMLRNWTMAVAVLTMSVTGSVRGGQPPATPLAVPVNSAPHPAPEQPLPFSHRQHVAGLHLDCRSCHTNPEPGRQMTFPETSTCMGCHTAIATGEPAIKKLAEYASAGQPIPWVRVYMVLPGVTWTHRKHLQAGLKCESCHGPVGELPEMQELSAVTSMATCIGCHQHRHVSSECVTCHAWPQPAPPSSPWTLPASLEGLPR